MCTKVLGHLAKSCHQFQEFASLCTFHSAWPVLNLVAPDRASAPHTVYDEKRF